MRTVLGALCALVALAAPVAADEPFPTRPITIVNAFPPGAARRARGHHGPTARCRDGAHPEAAGRDRQQAGRVGCHIAYQDADEFTAWWDRDARTLAAVIKRMGKTEVK